MSKTSHTKRKKTVDKPQRDYDQDLISLVGKVRGIAEEVSEESSPKCPTCGESKLGKAGTTKGTVSGEKPIFKCKNKACPKKGRTFVSDDDRYRNVFLKMNALLIVATQGEDKADEALKSLEQYGVNSNNSLVARYLRSLNK